MCLLRDIIPFYVPGLSLSHFSDIGMSAPSTNDCGQLGTGWFSEDPKEKMIVGQSFSLKVKQVLYHKRSKYQDILVFKSP